MRGPSIHDRQRQRQSKRDRERESVCVWNTAIKCVCVVRAIITQTCSMRQGSQVWLNEDDCVTGGRKPVAFYNTTLPSNET